MRVIPAIDILGGKCVRLAKGDYGRSTVFSSEPSEMAQRWVKKGAKELHVIDLDAARGSGSNRPAIAEIIRKSSLPVQVGGGVRSEADAEFLFAAGASRIIIGTMLFEKPEAVKAICSSYGSERIIASVDAEGGKVRVRGWLQGSRLSLADGAKLAEKSGVGSIIYTSIARDGMLGGPDIAGIAEVARNVSVPVIAAGGISSCEDILAAKAAGASGAILGMALYAGKISLTEALKC